MATKKQRRRREKDQRHDWEVVYVDDAGNEIESPAEASPAGKPAARTAKAQAPRGRGGRPLRELQPPSLPRALKWAGGFAVAMFVFTSTAGKGTVLTSFVTSLVYGVMFVPLFYFMHRVQYRAYVRMRDRAAAKKS